MSVKPQKIKPLIAGNWKMNGGAKGMVQLKSLIRHLGKKQGGAEVMICPPAIDISQAVQLAKGSKLGIGGQDCHEMASGAFTGDISAQMFKAYGAKAVIVGHSERRQGHLETNKNVKAKAQAVCNAGLTSILCIGETLKERKAGQTLSVIGAQLRGSIPQEVKPQKLIIAYEPVWAIGTGHTPTADQVAQVHAHIRKR